MHLTSGQEFYYRLCAAREAQDLASLAALYHSDAVSLCVSTGQVFRGRGAILDSFKHAFRTAGAISSRSVESLVEAGGAVCVEATLATRFAQMQTYDVYLLQAGMVKQHIGGLISPRPPAGQQHGQGLPQTRGGAFYHRLHAMVEAQDFVRLQSLYHPDVISVACSANQSSKGREAVISSFKKAAQNGGSVKLNSVESFVESGEIICAETTQTIRLVSQMGSMQFDVLAYEVLVLRSGQIGQSFSGLISPRGPELQQAVKQQSGLLFELQRERQRMIWDAFQNSLYPGYRRWR